MREQLLVPRDRLCCQGQRTLRFFNVGVGGRDRGFVRTRGVGRGLRGRLRGRFASGGAADPELGARPLRRAIQTYVEDVLSEKILFKQFRAGQTIVIDVAEGDDGPELSFEGVEGLPPSVDFDTAPSA